jgi:PAS domain S-box-containing protein
VSLTPTAPGDPGRYRGLFHHAPSHGIALLDAAGTIVDWNEAMDRVIGVSRDAATGRDHLWLLRALGLDGPPGELLERARAGAAVAQRVWTTAIGGSRRHCDVRLSAVRDPLGTVTGFAVAVADATEPPRTVPGDAATDSRYARALRHGPVAVFEQDRELRYVWVPMAIPGLGVADPEAAIGRTDADLLAPDVAERLAAVKRGVVDRGIGARVDVALDGAAGSHDLDLTIEPVRDASGAIVGITCTAVDVTDRRRVEEELRRSRALLAQSERLARVGSWEWDVERDVIQWSDGLYEIYGLTPETFDARWAARDQREQRVHPDDLERAEAAVAAALETAGGFEMEYRIIRPDGRVRRVHSRAEVIVGEDGRPVRLTGTAQDVTEIRAAEEALEQTAAELGRQAAELHRVARRTPGTGGDLEQLLTARQLEVLALIADGCGNAEIATRLYLSESTVKWHVRQILRKLRVANRAEAVARYVRTMRAER